MSVAASIAFVLAQDAKAIAQKWAEDNNLPLDLRGKVFSIPSFPDEATARFFNPKRSLQAHQLIINQLARIARKRGAKIQRELLDEDCYRIALDAAEHSTDTLDDRATFIANSYRIEDRDL